MLNITARIWFRSISIILIATFLSLDIAWAYPDISTGTSNLSPAALTQRGSAALPVKLDIQIKGTLLTTAKYLFGDKARGLQPIPADNLLTLQAALRSENSEALSTHSTY